MAHTSMLHVRVDDTLKKEATEKLANFGLTLSDAVRILLTRITKEGGLPVGLTSDPEAHDAWFRERVKEALNSEEVLPHSQVMDDVQALIERKNDVHKLEWLSLARNDLLAIVDYISDDNPKAALRLKDDIQAKAEKLMDFPKIGKVGRIEGTRELVAFGNYIIVYRESGTIIRILRILHAAQQWPSSK